MGDINKPNHFDAIVIGSGISGGFAAMELCTKGYKTLVLERGRMVKHGEYPTAHMDTWDLPNRNKVSLEEREQHFEKQDRLNWWVNEDNKHWINKDDVNPYNEDERFDWIRGDHVGGRSIMWGRQCYRWSDIDFEANLKEGVAVDWPIRYRDIEPWYDYVETFVGVSGQAEGLKQIPDGKFLKPFPLNCAEQGFRESVANVYPDRVVTPGRVAHLTEYNPEVHKGARGQCQARDRCWRGCPFGAYFSSQSATLPVATETGNLTIRADSVVMEILYDATTKKASGVKVKDANTGEILEYTAQIIFLNASSVASASILLNSRSETFPNGLGNTSGEIGHNLMDHHYGMGASGILPGHEDDYFQGRKPTGFYIPRFTNIDEESKQSGYTRGFGYQGSARRIQNNPEGLVGDALKAQVFKPGPYHIGMTCFGEMLPYHENRMYLNFEQQDKHGFPLITFDAKLRENENKLREHGVKCAVEMLEAAGCTNISSYNSATAPGACIHEMGTARMGRDPKTSVLNQWNQMHDVPNVFVTDGACMTSSGTQNPSITYMALTARAVDYAHKQIQAGKL
ncbi:GMC oxidoreductase [Paraglaciecola hydrolytica]|uniref:GMC family oxidoreductase n=1 Tax=Paraglaciecola hydrolytica TaxID=1799789 RepID=A0A148KMP3_9ALTE|nr:GMC family oxidoreductase [Paraglaciecola hydrolytica]KXI27551.1 GMC family oxidoreductase [Paraglaciecola hydrolytica]